MWKKPLLLMLIGILIGCTPTVTMTPTHSFNQGTKHFMTPTSTAPILTSETMEVSLTQISIPYRDTQVLNESPDFQLIARTPGNITRIVNLSERIVENELPALESVINDPVISKDGLLIAQITRQDDKKVLQIKNLITDEDSLVNLPTEAVLAEWLNNTKLAIWGGSPEGGCLCLLLIYDNFTTLISNPPDQMPELQQSECLQLPLLTTDGTKMIYPWKMFDFQTTNSINVLPFLSKFPVNPPSYSMSEIDERISVAFVSEDKLSYLVNTPLADIHKVNINPGTIQLPGLGTKSGWWQPFLWWPSQSQIGIDLIDQKIDPLEFLVSGKQVPTNFYFIDFDTSEIFDYDLDRAVFIEGSPPQRTKSGFPSPDGKYFAWAIYDGRSGLPIGSKVLELSSGLVISIPELEVLGWVSRP